MSAADIHQFCDACILLAAAILAAGIKGGWL